MNPGFPVEGGIYLCRRTLWFQDDLDFLCKRYTLMDECKFYQEVIDTSKYPEDKQELYAKTAREFYFKIFEPKDIGEDVEVVSSDSGLDSTAFDSTTFDSTDIDFDFDSTGHALLDSTLDFEEDE